MERAAWRNAGCAVTSATRSPSTKTRRPSFSERRYSAPVRIDAYPRFSAPTIGQLRRGGHSIDVGLVTAGFLEFRPENRGLFGVAHPGGHVQTRFPGLH